MMGRTAPRPQSFGGTYTQARNGAT